MTSSRSVSSNSQPADGSADLREHRETLGEASRQDRARRPTIQALVRRSSSRPRRHPRPGEALGLLEVGPQCRSGMKPMMNTSAAMTPVRSGLKSRCLSSALVDRAIFSRTHGRRQTGRGQHEAAGGLPRKEHGHSTRVGVRQGSDKQEIAGIATSLPATHTALTYRGATPRDVNPQPFALKGVPKQPSVPVSPPTAHSRDRKIRECNPGRPVSGP